MMNAASQSKIANLEVAVTVKRIREREYAFEVILLSNQVVQCAIPHKVSLLPVYEQI